MDKAPISHNRNSLPFVGKLHVPEELDSMIEEWWHELRLQNKAYFIKRRSDAIPVFAVSEQMVQATFTIGNRLHQTMDIQLLTIELLDRFLCKDYSSNRNAVWKNSQSSKKEKREKWLRLKKLMKTNFVLRILSCMQIASKQVSNIKFITPRDILDLLSFLGYKISLQDIVVSERKVYQKLDFMVPTSPPLVYIEHLLYMLPPSNLTTDMDILYSTCAHILGVVYVYHQTIYDSLYYIITSKKKRSKKERMDFLGVECDRVFLASAVILSAADVHQDNFCWVLLRLEVLTGIPLQDIEGLAVIIKDCATTEINVKVNANKCKQRKVS